VTRKIQQAFFRAVRGEDGDRRGWLTPVPAVEKAAAPAADA
jgi:hypothetical protein